MDQINKDLNERKEIENFRKYLEDQKVFPKNLSSVLLLRFLMVCDYDIQEAAKLLQFNLEFRVKNPLMFTNRDFASKEIQKAVNTFQIYSLPKYTKENFRVTVSRLCDEDPSNFDVLNIVKWFLIVVDAGFVRMPPNGLPDKEIGVMDFKGFTWWHLVKVAQNLSVIRALLKYVQEAVPYKIAENHYINCSPILMKIIALIRPFVKKELFDVMHFHTSGYESLHEFIPKEVLPIEYRGTGDSSDNFFKSHLKIVEDHLFYVLNEENWTIKDEK